MRYPYGAAVSVYYRGSFGEIWKAYEVLQQYIQTHGYVVSGYPQEIYLEIDTDGSRGLDGVRNLTQVIIPVKRNG